MHFWLSNAGCASLGCSIYPRCQARWGERCGAGEFRDTTAYPFAVAVDKHEQMLGSYGPSPTGEPYTKKFDPEVRNFALRTVHLPHGSFYPGVSFGHVGKIRFIQRQVKSRWWRWRGLRRWADRHSPVTFWMKCVSDFEWTFKLTKEWWTYKCAEGLLWRQAL